ncbi:hypothetical protein H312_02719, partial [Anncaliia algerae PRA339]
MYKKEFRKSENRILFNKGDLVLVRNKLRTKKMEDHFKDKAIILERLYGEIYKIKFENGKESRRHESQLKLFRRG